jgi:hypothetical protein
MLGESKSEKWYFKTYWIIIAFLVMGPLALPLVWLHPNYNRKKKIVITVITLILSYFLVMMLINSLKMINKYYQTIFSSGLPNF